jgi:hypothetical protein
MDSSLADMTWACAPHIAVTTCAGVPPWIGAASPARSSRLALTCCHDISITHPPRFVRPP